ncbi:MAG: DJ-1/PfpI family protein [Planctomycetota bacterium]
MSIRPLIVVLAVLACVRGARAQEPAATEPLNVGFLVVDGVYNSELAAPYDIFHHTVFHVQPGMKVFTVGRTKEPVKTFEGLRIAVDHDLASAPRIDVLVVPSAEHSMDWDLADEKLIAWVRARGKQAKYVLSICDGAFVLAEAGLLENRACTTFPGDIEAFRKKYPKLNVVEGVRFVADGPAITGVGGALSYDPALYLVQHLYGDTVVRGVARGMALRWDVEQVRHLIVPNVSAGEARAQCFMPGEEIDGDVTVRDGWGEDLQLADVVEAPSNVKAVVLTIIAGAAATDRPDRGGMWCEDSIAEIPNLRYLKLQYADRGVLFVGVLCPPVYHEDQFGYRAGAFLKFPDDHGVFQSNYRTFVDACQRVHRTLDLPFDVIVYDPRFHLLASARRGARPETGDAPRWQGRFKWHEDDQTYGTPTTWILTPDLEVIGPPFFKNVYESEGRKIRYTAKDMEIMLDRVLKRRAPKWKVGE